MGIRALFRAGQQSAPKTISTDFSSDFGAADIEDLVAGVSQTTKKTLRGRRWSFLRGTWGLSNNELSATTSADYPIAIVDALVPDVSIEMVNVKNGAGAAIWVTDAGNWWGVGAYQQPENCNCSSFTYQCNCANENYDCNCQTTYSSCNCTTTFTSCNCTTTTTSCNCQTCYGNYCSSYGCTASSCSGYTKICAAYGCTSYGCTSRAYGIAGQPCVAYGCTGYGCSSFANYCSSYSCSAYGCTGYTKISFSCNCQTCSSTTCQTCAVQSCQTCANTSCQTCSRQVCQTCSGTSCQTCYPAYIRLMQSAANTVTTIANWAMGSVARSLRISTNNKEITVQAFSDTSLATLIEENSHSATTATETTKFGLLVSPSQYAESRSVQQIKIERNT